MKRQLSPKLLAARSRLETLAEVYVPEADQFATQLDVWLLAIERDYAAARRLIEDCAA